MGIVVMLAMLVGLVILVARLKGVELNSSVVKAAVVFVVLCGLWNTFWYGLQHLQQFWGLAALGSGLAMLVAAWSVLTEQRSIALNRILASLLAAFFLLYFVTIVQLNLGLPIIQ